MARKPRPKSRVRSKRQLSRDRTEDTADGDGNIVKGTIIGSPLPKTDEEEKAENKKITTETRKAIKELVSHGKGPKGDFGESASRRLGDLSARQEVKSRARRLKMQAEFRKKNRPISFREFITGKRKKRKK